MPSVHPLFDLSGPRRARTLAIWAAFAAMLGAAVYACLIPDRASGSDDVVHVVALVAWGLLALAYAWMRYRPRKPYDETAVRPRAEAFQAKRARLLILCAAYVAVLLTPLVVYETLFKLAHATLVDRVFYAAFFLGPCGLVIGLITTGLYSRAWGAVVDDELTFANRAKALRAGFASSATLGAAAYATILLRPDWAPGAIPLVIGLSVAVAGLRFALLELAAAATDG